MWLRSEHGLERACRDYYQNLGPRVVADPGNVMINRSADRAINLDRANEEIELAIEAAALERRR